MFKDDEIIFPSKVTFRPKSKLCYLATYLTCGNMVREVSHLVIHQSCERQVVEHVREHFPHRRVAVLPNALVVKPIPVADSFGTSLG